MLRLVGSGVSDVGRVRPHNEDSGFVGPTIALVADGVGGAAAGEVASATAAYAMTAALLAADGVRLEERLAYGHAAARESLRRGVEADPERLGMATTLTCVVTDGERVVLAHVGDSRAYLLRDRELVQLSRDHTYVQHLVDRGELSPDAASRHPWRNVVLRSLDGGPELEHHAMDVQVLDVRVGDRLLLCSDGLTDLVPPDRIRQVLGLHEPLSAAAVLTQSALRAGGRDNITCLVVDVEDGPRVVGDGRLLGALGDVANLVDPAAVHLA